MSRYEKFRIVLYCLWLDIKSLPGKLKRRIWNKYILLWWNRLWVRKDEFHSSLSIDFEAILEMNQKERKQYFDRLLYRRVSAHQRNLDK